MRTRIAFAASLLAVALCGCHPALLRGDDRERLCHVVVEPAHVALEVTPNPWNDPATAAQRRASGTALLLFGALLSPGYLILVPELLQSMSGCVEGAQTHPTLPADFRDAVATADVGVLSRALEQGLNARSVCAGRAAAAPDVVIVLDGVAARPGCAYGEWSYAIAATWHATRADGRELVAAHTTVCGAAGARNVDAWLADRDRARLEVEQMLGFTGEQIAADLLSDSEPERYHRFYYGKDGLVRQ